MPDDEDVKIISLDLTPQSMKKWRDVNDKHPIYYPVLLKLSRQLDPFERHAITVLEGHTFVPAENDRALLLMPDTTLESVRERISDLTARINRVVEAAESPRAAASAEDSRLLDLLSEINRELSGQ
jgi:hypothetical protein